MAQKRRSNGEGSIIQLKSGTWAGQYTYQGKRKAVYGKTQQEARQKLKEVLSFIEQGLDLDSREQSLGDWLDYWLKFYAKPRVKRATYINYEANIRLHVKPDIGGVPFKKLSVRVFQEYLVRLLEESGLSQKSVRNIKNMLHSAMQQAVINDLITKNFIEFVQLPKLRKTEERVLSQEEQDALVFEARHYPHEASFGIIFDVYTGLRKGELLGLQWRDFDEDKRTITVRRAINRLHVANEAEGKPKTEILIGSTKSSCSDREIPLFDKLYDELIRYKERQMQLKEQAGVAHEDTDFIFTGRNFCHVEPRYFETIFQNVASRAGIEDAHIHTLRHTFATRALESGVDIYVLSKLLGHAQPSTTLNKYGHALPSHKRECMDKLSEVYRSGS